MVKTLFWQLFVRRIIIFMSKFALKTAEFWKLVRSLQIRGKNPPKTTEVFLSQQDHPAGLACRVGMLRTIHHACDHAFIQLYTFFLFSRLLLISTQLNTYNSSTRTKYWQTFTFSVRTKQSNTEKLFGCCNPSDTGTFLTCTFKKLKSKRIKGEYLFELFESGLEKL